MSPQPDLRVRMTDLARELRSQPTSDETLEHVLAATVRLVEGCHHAGVSLARRKGQIASAAANSDIPHRSDLLQEELGQGPCMDAVWEHEVVHAPDLERDPRWPGWAPRARRELGVRSMLCVRLFTHEDTVGALNLFSEDVDAFTEDDVAEVVSIAAHAAVAVAASVKLEGLEQALQTRGTIAAATGMLMVEFGLTEAQAWSLMRRLSSESNVKVAVLSRRLISSHEATLKGPAPA